MYYVFGVLLAAGVKVVINKTGVAAGRTRNRKNSCLCVGQMQDYYYSTVTLIVVEETRWFPIGNEILYSCKYGLPLIEEMYSNFFFGIACQ